MIHNKQTHSHFKNDWYSDTQLTKKAVPAWARGLGFLFMVYYEQQIQWEWKEIHVWVCRCHEGLDLMIHNQQTHSLFKNDCYSDTQFTKKEVPAWARGLGFLFMVYNEQQMQWEWKEIHIWVCRCHEGLKPNRRGGGKCVDVMKDEEPTLCWFIITEKVRTKEKTKKSPCVHPWSLFVHANKSQTRP